VAWRDDLDARQTRGVDRSIRRAIHYLRQTQRRDGAWVPLWFGHQDDPLGQNALYGTARVIPAFCLLASSKGASAGPYLMRARDWMIAQQNQDGGWSGAAGAASSVEETGLAITALVDLWTIGAPADRNLLKRALARGARWLASSVEANTWQCATPIGLYFAQLWYHERSYPLIFATAALNRLSDLR
jgi:squalene-hopene/tetraprenyl-beta-curcumene cyclase